MERDQAHRILKILADGRDPATGQPQAADSPYQQPEVIRALCHAVSALEAPAGRARKQGTASGDNAGKAWSKEEDERLVAGFDAGESAEALAQAHGRSRFAIEVRLAKFDKVPAPAATRFPTTRERATEPEASYRVPEASHRVPEVSYRVALQSNRVPKASGPMPHISHAAQVPA